jgi:hypothetical protein
MKVNNLDESFGVVLEGTYTCFPIMIECNQTEIAELEKQFYSNHFTLVELS